MIQKICLLGIIILLLVAQATAHTLITDNYEVATTTTGLASGEGETNTYDTRVLFTPFHSTGAAETDSYVFDPGYFDPITIDNITFQLIDYDPYPPRRGRDVTAYAIILGDFTDVVMSYSVNNGSWTNVTSILVENDTYSGIIPLTAFGLGDTIYQKWYVLNAYNVWVESPTVPGTIYIYYAIPQIVSVDPREEEVPEPREEETLISRVMTRQNLAYFIILIAALLVLFSLRRQKPKKGIAAGRRNYSLININQYDSRER